MQFLEYQMMEAKNLLCCDTQLNPESFSESLREINDLLSVNTYQKQEATYYLIFSNLESSAVSLYISLKNKISNVKEPFRLKERIHLAQAVKTRHEGPLSDLGDSLLRIMQYLDKRKLSPITPFCCKVLAGLDDPADTRNMIMDIYVGVNINVI